MTDSPESTILAGLECVGDRGKEAAPLDADVLAAFHWLRDRLMSYPIRFRPLTVQDCEEVVRCVPRSVSASAARTIAGKPDRLVVPGSARLKRLQASRQDSQNVVTLTGAVEETIAGPGLNPEDMLAQDETRRQLLAVVRALPEQDQPCLALRAEG